MKNFRSKRKVDGKWMAGTGGGRSSQNESMIKIMVLFFGSFPANCLVQWFDEKPFLMKSHQLSICYMHERTFHASEKHKHKRTHLRSHGLGKLCNFNRQAGSNPTYVPEEQTCTHEVCKLNNCHQPHAYIHTHRLATEIKPNQTEANARFVYGVAPAHGNVPTIKSRRCSHTEKLIYSKWIFILFLCLCLCINYECSSQILSKHLLLLLICATFENLLRADFSFILRTHFICIHSFRSVLFHSVLFSFKQLVLIARWFLIWFSCILVLCALCMLSPRFSIILRLSDASVNPSN